MSEQHEENKWKRIAWEFFNYPDTMGGFFHLLCLAIQHADMENTARIRLGFPELVAYIRGEKQCVRNIKNTP